MSIRDPWPRTCTGAGSALTLQPQPRGSPGHSKEGWWNSVIPLLHTLPPSTPALRGWFFFLSGSMEIKFTYQIVCPLEVYSSSVLVYVQRCVTIITANHRTFLSPAKETLYPLAIAPQHADLLVTTCPLSVSTDLLAPDIPQVGHHTPCGLVWILVLSRKSAGFISVVAGGGAVFTPASFPGGSVLTSSEQPPIYLPKPVSHPRNCQQRRASDGRRVGTACACGHSPRD